jgi:exodeoxyribonuclease V beta subunit
MADMFFNVVNSTIDDTTGIKLADIDLDSRLSELEFLFPIDNFNSKRFREIFKNQTIYCDKIYKKLIYNYTDDGGMMKGFIDLVFVYDGKYYIADWKSNYIGSDYSDYVYDRLEEEMDKHNYYLQYYIYTTALNRYLKHRIPNYSYEEHIGGVFYFFFFFMNIEGSNKTGEYH